jgi:hypothetical protein
VNIDQLLYNVVRPIAPVWFANRWREQHEARILSLDSLVTLSPTSVSKCGVHSCGSKRAGYGEFLAACYAGNRQPGGVLCVGDFGAAFEAKQLFPEVMTIGRLGTWDGIPFTDYENLKKLAALNPWIDAWLIYNEINGAFAVQTAEQRVQQIRSQSDDYIRLLPQFAADGLKLIGFGTASGTPFRPGEGGGEGDFAYSQIARVCQFAQDNGYFFGLAMHEYWTPGDTDGAGNQNTIGRCATMDAYLTARGLNTPIYITEFGLETYTTFEQYMACVRAADQIYMQIPRVKFFATWTTGRSGWGGSDIAPILPAMGEYVATVEPFEPPIPPEPPIDPIAYARTYYLLHGSQYNAAWCAPAYRTDRMWSCGQSPHDAFDVSGHQVARRVIAINPHLWPQPLAMWAAANYPGGYELIEIACADARDIEAAVNAKVGA